MGRTACTEPQCLYKGTLYYIVLRNTTTRTNFIFTLLVFMFYADFKSGPIRYVVSLV